MRKKTMIKSKLLPSLLLTFYNVALVVTILTLITVYETMPILISSSWWFFLPFLITNCLCTIIMMSILAIDFFTWKYGLAWLIDEWVKKDV